jgi:hypothetical protein
MEGRGICTNGDCGLPYAGKYCVPTIDRSALIANHHCISMLHEKGRSGQRVAPAARDSLRHFHKGAAMNFGLTDRRNASIDRGIILQKSPISIAPAGAVDCTHGLGERSFEHLARTAPPLRFDRKADFDRHLPVGDFPGIDVAARFDHLKPAHVADRGRGFGDCVLDRILDPDRG